MIILCPKVMVLKKALYPTMKGSEITELPPHICEMFRARGCRKCDGNCALKVC